MVFVYIIKSLIDSGYYIGITGDVDKRLIKHNQGGVRSTNKRKPFKLVHVETFENYTLARVREKELKSYKGGNKFRKLIS